MTFSRLAAAVAASQLPVLPDLEEESAATEALTESSPQLPSLFDWTNGRDMEDMIEKIAMLPTEDAKLLGEYVYRLYLSIFDDVSPTHTAMAPIYIRHNTRKWQLADVREKMQQSRNSAISELGKTSEDDPLHMQRLERAAMMTNLLQAFPDKIFYLVMTVYCKNGKDYSSKVSVREGDSERLKVYIPNSQDRLIRMEHPGEFSCSYMGIATDLPLFWRWMMVVNRPLYDGLDHSNDTIEDAAMRVRFVLDVLMASARQMSILNYKGVNRRGFVPASFGNLMAMTSVMYEIAKGAPSKDIYNAVICKSILGRPLLCVDLYLVRSFLNLVLGNAFCLEEVANALDKNLNGDIPSTFYGSMVREINKSAGRGVKTDLAQMSPDLKTFSGAIEDLVDEINKEFQNGGGFSITSSDEEEEEEDPNADPSATATTDSDDTGPSSEDPNSNEEGDSELAANGDGVNNYIASDTEAENDSSISLINLANADEGLTAHLYRRAVLQACEQLELRPELGIDPEKLDLLKDWCLRWLWLASIEDTKQLVENLSIKSLFKTIPA